ncbi:unnamed protein product, partial [Symbiodinium necroappetens]
MEPAVAVALKDSSELVKLKAERDRLEEVFSTQQEAAKAAEAALATATEEQTRWRQRVSELQKLRSEQAAAIAADSERRRVE